MNSTLTELGELAKQPGKREERARAAARLIRTQGAYRWAALYDVSADEIAVIAWDGPEPPSYPRFPRSKGLNGAAVATKRAVIVQDVARDPRYLRTIGGTCGEMIQPIVDSSGAVIGTIDVETDRVNAFTSYDEVWLTACAISLQWLWAPESP
jgi:GAF domain-containing protein